MGSDVNGSVLGELESVLSEQGWAGQVSAGHQRPAIGRNLDKRIPDVGPALGVQPKIAQDPLVGPATTEETGPNEAGRVGRRGRSGRHGRQCVLTIHALDESAAVTVRVVVRKLEMAIGAHLQGDLTEDVRRRNPTVRRTQGAGIEGVGVPEDVLETRRAGVADADTDRDGAAITWSSCSASSEMGRGSVSRPGKRPRNGSPFRPPSIWNPLSNRFWPPLVMPPEGAEPDDGEMATCGLKAVRVKKSRLRFGRAAMRAAETISEGPVRPALRTASAVARTTTGASSTVAGRSVKSAINRWPSASTMPFRVSDP